MHKIRITQFCRYIAVFFTLLTLLACSRTQKLSPLPPDSVVLAFGNSVTYGTGAGSGEGWPELIAETTGWQVINAGIPGDTAENGKSRIQDLLQEYQPALVIVEIGGNDFLKRKPHIKVKEDIRSILQQIRTSGAMPILIAAPELSFMAAVAKIPSDAELYEELAREESVPLIPDVFSDVLAEPELRADPIHPNASGYRKMADGIYTKLKKLNLISTQQ